MMTELRRDEPEGGEPIEVQEDSSVRRITRRFGELAALPLIGLLRFYQLVISPLTPPSCRYYPSCSAYAVTSLRRFGPIKGTWLAIRRVLRCHPWAPGGVDHVPTREPRATDVARNSRGRPPAKDADAPTPTPSDSAHSSGRPTPRDKGLS